MEKLAEDPSATVPDMLMLGMSSPAPTTEEPKQISPVSKARPQGPTPLKASGKGSPASTRPGNPTPAHAGAKPDERRSDMSQKGCVTDQPIIEESKWLYNYIYLVIIQGNFHLELCATEHKGDN